MAGHILADDFTIESKPLAKNVLKYPELQEWLPQLADRYETLARFNLEETERVARELADELAIKPGIIINAMRTVVTGQLAGPSMFDILVTIGKRESFAGCGMLENFCIRIMNNA